MPGTAPPAGSTFGELVRYYRARVRLSQQDLADRLGCARLTIRNWEGRRAGKPVSRKLLEKFRREAGLTPEEYGSLLGTTALR